MKSGHRMAATVASSATPTRRSRSSTHVLPSTGSAARRSSRLATGYRWAEGPVWFGDGRYLVWSDIPNNRMMRWCEETGAVSVFRSPSNNSNGNTRDRQGRLITCEHGTRAA